MNPDNARDPRPFLDAMDAPPPFVTQSTRPRLNGEAVFGRVRTLTLVTLFALIVASTCFGTLGGVIWLLVAPIPWAVCVAPHLPARVWPYLALVGLVAALVVLVCT